METTLTTLLGYFVILQFFFLDRNRRGAEAKSFKTGEFDRRSTMYIGIAYFISMLVLIASWFLNGFGLATLPEWIGWIGIAVAVFGLFFRWWANRLLGPLYTRTLRVMENHPIVQVGPYRVIRHPGYLGSILIWVGAAAATVNWIVLLVVFAVMSFVYAYRIQSEEKMLTATKAGYAEYQKHTWRLIPFVY